MSRVASSTRAACSPANAAADSEARNLSKDRPDAWSGGDNHGCETFDVGPLECDRHLDEFVCAASTAENVDHAQDAARMMKEPNPKRR